LISLWLLASATARIADAARAAALYERILPLAERCVMSGGCVFTGSMSLPLALLAETLGRLDDAERHFRAALATHERVGARAFVARTRYELARMLLARGTIDDRDAALDLLHEALEEAQRLGMKAIVERAIGLTVAAEGIAPGDTESSIDSITASVGARRPNLAAQAAPDGIVTLMFSDMEGFSAMTERLGDDEAYRVTKVHNALIRAAVETHGGFEVENQGDGFMVAFASASRALRCAVDIQRGFAGPPFCDADPPIRVRIGLHTGEPIKEGHRFFGRTVILAARIAAYARGGEILASSVFRQLVAGMEATPFGPAREIELKGLAGRHSICAALWQAPAEATAAEAPAPSSSMPPAEPDRNVFRKEGDYWQVSYAGKSVRLLDLKGMRDIANLLRHAGTELHVSELAALDEDAPNGDGAADPSSDERLRKAVSARIRESLARIRREHADLGRHLTNSVRTGTRCSYRPERPTAWRL
jgi:class 3 adenylate cyclase